MNYNVRIGPKLYRRYWDAQFLLDTTVSANRTAITHDCSSKRGIVRELDGVNRPLSMMKEKRTCSPNVNLPKAIAAIVNGDASQYNNESNTQPSSGKSFGIKQRYMKISESDKSSATYLFHFAKISAGKGSWRSSHPRGPELDVMVDFDLQVA